MDRTIKYCFHHAGFFMQAEEATEDALLAEDRDELDKVVESLAGVTNVQTTAEEFATIDSDVETAAEVSVSEIVQSLLTQNHSESEDEPQIEVEEVAKDTTAEARVAIQTLRRFAQQQEKGNCLFNP